MMIAQELHMMGSNNGTVTPPPKRSAHKIKMPYGFVPGRFTVICGRGKLCTASPGNKYLRSIVNNRLAEYSMAKNKTEKSAIVSSVMHEVREVCPIGSFVKQESNGEWWEVDDSFAREKIGCIIRDVLHTQYKSSTKSKSARKKSSDTGGESNKKQSKKAAGARKTKSSGASNRQRVVQKSIPSADHTSLNKTVSKISSLPTVSSNVSNGDDTATYVEPTVQTPLTRQVTNHDLLHNLAKVNCDAGSNSMMKPLQSDWSIPLRNWSSAFMRPHLFNAQTSTVPQQQQVVFPSMDGVQPNLVSSSLPKYGVQRSATMSLLQGALGIIDHNADLCDYDDFPDDLSDVFSDDTSL